MDRTYLERTDVVDPQNITILIQVPQVPDAPTKEMMEAAGKAAVDSGFLGEISPDIEIVLQRTQ